MKNGKNISKIQAHIDDASGSAHGYDRVSARKQNRKNESSDEEDEDEVESNDNGEEGIGYSHERGMLSIPLDEGEDDNSAVTIRQSWYDFISSVTFKFIILALVLSLFFFYFFNLGYHSYTVSQSKNSHDKISPVASPTSPTFSPLSPTQQSNPTSSPVIMQTASPTAPTFSPTNPTAKPVPPTNKPILNTQKPTLKPTHLPTRVTIPPSEDTDSPTKPTPSPVNPTNRPTILTVPPSEVTDAPTPKPAQQKTPSPTKATDSPTKATTPPTKTTDSPTKVTSQPTKATSSPVNPSGNNSKSFADLSQKLKKGKQKANEVINMLWKYYEPKSHEMLNRALMYGFGDETKNDKSITSRPYDEENQKYITDRIARALVHKENFIVGGIGSSVMVGHDNCATDAYQVTMSTIMAPVFDQTDSKFIWRNAGEGGACEDNHVNQIFCFVQLAGEDIDILHFEWTYFLYRGVFIEMLLRWLLYLPKAPALHVYHTGGDDRSHKLLPPSDFSQFVPAVLAREGGSSANVKAFNDVYKKYGFNSYMMERHLSLNGKYAGKDGGKIGDGMHQTTRKGEQVKNDPEEVKSQGVVFRNWHPGPLGFQATADAFSYSYLRSFIDAVDQITKAIDEGKDLATIWKKDFPRNAFKDIPTPAHYVDDKTTDVRVPNINPPPIPEKGTLGFYQSLHQAFFLEKPPECISYERPKYGNTNIEVLSPTASDNPYKEKIEKEKYKGWSTWVGSFHDLIPQKDYNRPECQHKDSCGSIHATDLQSGWLVMKIPKVKVGMVILCFGQGMGCNENCFDGLQKTPENYEIELDLKQVNPKDFIIINKKCFIVQQRFSTPLAKGVDHIILGLRAKKQCCAITQVIAV